MFPQRPMNSASDDVRWLSASCECSHGKQVAASSHAAVHSAEELSKGESGASLCLPPSSRYQVGPAPAAASLASATAALPLSQLRQAE